MTPRSRSMLLAVTLLTSAAFAFQQAPAPYPTPQGTPTENGLAGFAKITCSAVFVSGREAADAAQNSATSTQPPRRILMATRPYPSRAAAGRASAVTYVGHDRIQRSTRSVRSRPTTRKR